MLDDVCLYIVRYNYILSIIYQSIHPSDNEVAEKYQYFTSVIVTKIITIINIFIILLKGAQNA